MLCHLPLEVCHDSSWYFYLIIVSNSEKLPKKVAQKIFMLLNCLPGWRAGPASSWGRPWGSWGGSRCPRSARAPRPPRCESPATTAEGRNVSGHTSTWQQLVTFRNIWQHYRKTKVRTMHTHICDNGGTVVCSYSDTFKVTSPAGRFPACAGEFLWCICIKIGLPGKLLSAVP